ncbi:hypothetical protein, partial [Nocardioides sp.]|uniref:hypothetical protein n=1 Tax=Nocardioides sp. TaxID=35761 RepID=UPI001A1BA19E
PTPASPTLPPAPPADALEVAQDRLQESGTGRWELSVSNGRGGAVVTETGYFQLDPPASLSARHGVAEAPRNLTTVSQGPDLWFRARIGSDLDGCWAHRALDEQSPSSQLVPPALQVFLARMVETGATATTIDAAVPLLTAAAPFGETVNLMLLGLDAGYGNVPVRFSTADGELTGYTVALDDVLGVAQEAGVEPFPGLTDLHLVAEVQLADIGEPVSLTPPAPTVVVELGPRETVAEGLDRCGTV